MNKLIAIVGLLALALPCLAAPESKYNAAVTGDVDMVFGPRVGATKISSIIAKVDAAGSIALSARTGSRYAVTNMATTNVWLEASNTSITNNDVIVYSHAGGRQDYLTVAAATANKLELTATAAGVAFASGDAVYEMSQQGQIDITTTLYSQAGEPLFVTPVDSPLRVLLNGGASSNTITVTVSD